MSETSKALVAGYKEEINRQLADKATFDSLLEITFKGLTPQLAKRAMLEGMMRGHTFVDFLNKNVYAIPFKNRSNGEEGYTLITSIDYARQVGAQNGVSGKSKPTYVMGDNKKLISCEVTVYKKGGDERGYTAEVFFDEYTTGKNLWVTKPRTMLAKVAEMHALRMACPKELAKAYVEEEFDKAENAEKVSYTVVRKQHEDEDDDPRNAPNFLLDKSKGSTDMPADVAADIEAQS